MLGFGRNHLLGIIVGAVLYEMYYRQKGGR